MKLNDIVKNSNYITDEDLQDNNILGLSNLAIAEVNGRCNTNLPFFTEANLSSESYGVIPAFWVLRLIEPYLSYSIAANEGDANVRDFHYNRFLSAMEDFKNNGLSSISSSSYKADTSAKAKPLNVSDVTMHWRGWI